MKAPLSRLQWMQGVHRFLSESPEDTECLGEIFAGACEVGDVIALKGPLGAGKTCFVRGFVLGRGLKARVKSPTFTILQPYQGEWETVWHVDAYRLRDDREAEELGWDEWRGNGTIWVVEWADRVDGWISRFPHFEVCLTIPSMEQRGMNIRYVHGH